MNYNIINVGEIMKKFIFFLFCLTVICLLFQKENSNNLKIPKDSIRFRIIASSNEAKDQALKLNIRNDLLKELKTIEQNSTDINTTRQYINSNLKTIENKLDGYNIPYKINFGLNEFPQKEYNGNTYEAGKYESLVITLGNGLGDNWWCVLFPPLCLIEAEKNNLSEVKYDFYINKILNKYN